MQVWINKEDGDMMKVEEKADGTIYGVGNDFDFNAADEIEATAKLIGWGYELIGHE